MDIFESLLEDLSKEMDTRLTVDEHHTCLISYKETLKIQLELDRNQENLLIGTILGPLVSGKFREQVLKEALISNGESITDGIFAYSARKNELVLFARRRVDGLKSDAIHQLIDDLYEKALPWKEALSRGDIPRIQRKTTATASSTIFNIKL